MFKLRKIMLDNQISIARLALNIDNSSINLNFKLLKKIDFSIEDLNKIKDYFVKLGVISKDFDIGEFLKEI